MIPIQAAAGRRTRLSYTLPLLAALLAGVILLDIWMGEADVARVATPALVLRVLVRHLPGLAAHVPRPPGYIDAIVWNIRLPRVLAGALIGMLLAMAGVAFQSLLMNPLADPYFVGVSSGAGLGSVVVILLGGTGWLGGFGQTAAAFASGLAAIVVVLRLARVNGRVPVQTFLLAGIVVGTSLYSVTQLVVRIAATSSAPGRTSAILDQLLGTLSNVGWREVGLLLPFGLAGAGGLWTAWRELNIMAIGEESAAHLGVDTEALKRRVIVAGALVTAAAVSVAGIIPFVGMLAPQIARRLTGPDHRDLIPTATLLGGLMLVTSDWLSRVYLHGLAIGIITSLIGAPAFCWLLRRQFAVRV